MAETPVEVVIRARNEAQAALNQAIGQLKQLEGQTKRAGAAGASLGGLRNALSSISPAAATAAARIEGLAAAGAAFGVVGIAVTGATAAIGLLGGAAFVAAKKLADTVEQLDNLSRTTGVSVADLQVLQQLFERAGLGADVARTALHRLNVAIGDNNPLLAKLGITSRDTTTALFQLATAMSTSSDAGARAKVAQELLGRGGKDLLAVLDDLKTTFPALSAEMTATGQLMSGGMLDAGRKFDKEWERLTGRFEGFMNRIKHAAADAANGIIEAFSKPGTAEEAVDRQARAIEQRMKALAATIREEQKDLSGLGPTGNLFGDEVFERAARTRIAELEGELKRLDFTLRALRGTARGFGEDDLPAMTSAAGSANDVVAEAVKVHEKASAAVQRHAERVKELVDLFGFQKAAAEAIILVQEQMEREQRKEVLRKQLFVGPPEPEAGKPPELVLPKITDRERVIADWRDFVAEVTASASVLDDSIRTLGIGLQSGFNAVFQGLLGQGQTFKRAMVTLFRAMVSELLAQLARLLAFKVISFLLGGGLPTKALAGVPTTVQPLPPILPRGATAVLPGTFDATGGGNTYNIMTFDARAVVQELTSPAGSLRRAHDRLSMQGAY